MKLEDAEKLADTLRVTVQGRSIWHSYIDRRDMRSPRIVFTGGKKGEHSLDVGVSSRERIIAHWLGYIESNGFVTARVGESVSFPSASMPGGRRNGKVARVTGSRALITYRFKYTNAYKSGGRQAAPKWVPLWDLQVHANVPRRLEMDADRELVARMKALIGSKK